MGAIARAIVSLAQIEDKLRRALGLVGEVNLNFAPDLRPVILAGDATAPGNATLRGRRFAAGVSFAASGAAWSVTIKAVADVVITRWSQTGCGAIGGTLRLVTADVADPYAVATLFAPWTERRASGNDFAPLARSAVPAAANSDGTAIASWTGLATAATQLEMIHQPVFLAAGQKLVMQSGNASTLTTDWIIEGYQF